jgi:hypothetical protein
MPSPEVDKIIKVATLYDVAVSDWIVFESRPTVEKIMTACKQFCGNNAEELDHLFDEIAQLNEMLENLNKTEFI